MITKNELRENVEQMVAAVIQDYKNERLPSSDYGDMLVATAFVRHVIEAHAGATGFNRGDVWRGAANFVGENVGIFHEAAGRRFPGHTATRWSNTSPTTGAKFSRKLNTLSSGFTVPN
ncbi:hypothetical protein MASR1M32_16370 [Rhodobacter sp.]